MMRYILITLHLLLLAATAVGAAPAPMRYVRPPPESLLDRRYLYHWKILETALERTTPKWGPYVLESSVRMTERRQAHELKGATGKLTVMYLSTTPEFERDLVPVRIPVDKNLSGYFVLLVRAGEEARIASITTQLELRTLRFGLGFGWLDVDILRANELDVVTGSSYDGLFEMLVNGRFDVFPRSAVEIIDEYEQRKASMPTLRMEETLLLSYPLPMYFWFPRTDEGQKLADRVREGMLGMLDDGAFDAIFADFQDEKIRRLDLKNRRIIPLQNPLLGSATPFDDARLWFDPKTYVPRPP